MNHFFKKTTKNIQIYVGTRTIDVSLSINLGGLSIGELLESNLSAEDFVDIFEEDNIDNKTFRNYIRLLMSEGIESFEIREGYYDNYILEDLDGGPLFLDQQQRMEITLYWSLFKNKFDYSISERCIESLMEFLLATVNLELEVAKEMRDKIPSNIKNTLYSAVSELYFLLIKEWQKADFYSEKYGRIEPVSTFIDLLRTFSVDKIPEKSQIEDRLLEVSLFKDTPLCQELVLLGNWGKAASNKSRYGRLKLKWYSAFTAFVYLYAICEQESFLEELVSAEEKYGSTKLIKAANNLLDGRGALDISLMNSEAKPEDTNEYEIVKIGAPGRNGESCLLLKVQGYNMLLDCGFDLEDTETRQDINNMVENIDYIVLSRPPLENISSLESILDLWENTCLLLPSELKIIIENMLSNMIAKVEHCESDDSLVELCECLNRLKKNSIDLPYNCEKNIHEKFQCCFRPVVGLPGTSMVDFGFNGTKILYTGDTFDSVICTMNHDSFPFRYSRPHTLLIGVSNTSDFPLSTDQRRKKQERNICQLIQSGKTLLFVLSNPAHYAQLSKSLTYLRRIRSIQEDIPIFIYGRNQDTIKNIYFSHIDECCLLKDSTFTNILIDKKQKMIVIDTESFLRVMNKHTEFFQLSDETPNYRIIYVNQLPDSIWEKVDSPGFLINDMSMSFQDIENYLELFIQRLDPDHLVLGSSNRYEEFQIRNWAHENQISVIPVGNYKGGKKHEQ